MHYIIECYNIHADQISHTILKRNYANEKTR